MTRMTRYALEPNGARLIDDTEDRAMIERAMTTWGITFEAWQAEVPLTEAADQDAILAAYRRDLDRLIARGGYGSVDVIRMRPDHPERDAMRAKFLAEHVHDDDEVRFFVEGAGAFFLRRDDEVVRVVCTRGDLFNVPKGTRHWFDMGPSPAFCAIRLFTTPEGWVAHFTGDPIAAQLPGFPQETPTA